MSRSCLAFVLLSPAPNLLVSILVSPLFTVRSLSMHCYLCAPAVAIFFPTAGVSVFICSYLIPHADQDYLYPSNFATFANFAIGLD